MFQAHSNPFIKNYKNAKSATIRAIIAAEKAREEAKQTYIQWEKSKNTESKSKINFLYAKSVLAYEFSRQKNRRVEQAEYEEKMTFLQENDVIGYTLAKNAELLKSKEIAENAVIIFHKSKTETAARRAEAAPLLIHFQSSPSKPPSPSLIMNPVLLPTKILRYYSSAPSAVCVDKHPPTLSELPVPVPTQTAETVHETKPLRSNSFFKTTAIANTIATTTASVTTKPENSEKPITFFDSVCQKTKAFLNATRRCFCCENRTDVTTLNIKL